MDLNLLKQEVKAQWKVQSFNKEKTKATCVAYIDARDAMDLLDKVVGPENWQDKYEIHGDKVICGLGIKCENEWVWKFDTGTEGDIEQEKAIFSDAFKRAAVKWGVGRFLYSMDIRYCNAKSYNDKGYPVDEKGERIWDLTKYFEELGEKTPSKEIKEKEVVKKPAKPVTLTEEQMKKGVIFDLLTRLGWKPANAIESAAAIKQETGLDLTVENYNEIISRLTVIKDERKK